jgi:hypothetical protein
LKKTTASGPTTGDCGEYSWGIRWSLEDGDSTTQGWIIQNVNSFHDIKGCDDKSKTDAELKTLTGGWDTSWYPFWEAWKVKDGKVRVGDSDSLHNADTFGWPGPGDDTKGTRGVKANADFYPNLTLPASFTVRNAPPAHALPYTQTDEKLTGGTGLLKHNITATWNCCPKADGSKDKKTTVVPE